MGEVRKRKVSIGVTERNVTGQNVTNADMRITGETVTETKHASVSNVKRLESEPARVNKGKATKKAKAPDGKKGIDYGSARAKLNTMLDVAATTRAVSGMMDDDGGSPETDTVSEVSSQAWRMARKRKKARDKRQEPTKAVNEAENVTVKEKQARIADETLANRKRPAPNAKGDVSAAARKVGAVPKEAGGKAERGAVKQAAQAARSRAQATAAAKAASAQQVRSHMQAAIARQATEKTAGGGIITVIAGALGVPVAVVIGIIIAAILAIALIVIIVANLLGLASDEVNVEGLNEVESAVALHLRELGWDNVHIAAAMGNISSESGFSLGSLESGGGGMGLMQWTSDESHVRLKAIADDMKKPWTDIDVQLAMMDEWFDTVFQGEGGYTIVDPRSSDPPPGTAVFGSRPKFDASNDVAECTLYFCYRAERPGIPHESRRIDEAKRYLEILNSPTSGGGEIIDLPGGRLGNPMGTYPYVLSSGFGYRDFDKSVHQGIDMAAPEGTPYYAAADGIVLYATNGGGYNGGAGNWVVIDHGGGLVTKYMHSSVTYATPGQQVKKGQHIGNVGNTGASFGAHLHFQVEQNGQAVNPLPYLGR